VLGRGIGVSSRLPLPATKWYWFHPWDQFLGCTPYLESIPQGPMADFKTLGYTLGMDYPRKIFLTYKSRKGPRNVQIFQAPSS